MAAARRTAGQPLDATDRAALAAVEGVPERGAPFAPDDDGRPFGNCHAPQRPNRDIPVRTV